MIFSVGLETKYASFIRYKQIIIAWWMIAMPPQPNMANTINCLHSLCHVCEWNHQNTGCHMWARMGCIATLGPHRIDRNNVFRSFELINYVRQSWLSVTIHRHSTAIHGVIDKYIGGDRQQACSALTIELLVSTHWHTGTHTHTQTHAISTHPHYAPIKIDK